MIHRIFKYQINLVAPSEVPIVVPINAGAHIIGCEIVEPNVFSFWAEVDLGAPIENREFVLLWTGMALIKSQNDFRLVPLKTAVDRSTGLVWHVYEKIRRVH